MNRDEILGSPSMPHTAPAYPRGPWHYTNMEQLVITYESDEEAIRRVVPEPLRPAGDGLVTLEWRRMGEVTGFGAYVECGHSVNCTLDGEPAIYVVQAYLDSEPPTLAGRELLGFPKKHGEVDLKLVRETLVGTLAYGGVQVAVATMGYRAEDLTSELGSIEKALTTRQVVLKLIPDVDGTSPRVAELVEVGIHGVRLKGAWRGPAELFLMPHVGCRVAALPVQRMVEARQHLWDMILGDGRVIHDYLARS